MLKSEAAAYLAGVTQTEGAEASAPTNLHVITGEVGEASADGKTLVKIDGLMFSESDDQFIEVDALGGLEEGDIATIVLTGEQGHAMTPLALGSIGSVDRITVRIAAIEADYIKVEQLDAAKARIGELEADHVSVDDFNAATGRIGTLEATRATITDLEAATARIDDLEADHVSTDDLDAATARIGTLETNTADIGTIRANSAKVQNLTADELEADHAKVGQLDVDQIAADHATIGTLDTTYATIANLDAANGRITNLESSKANISDLEADYITADEIESTYMHANMSNSDVAWIENGTIKNGAIVSAMINDVSANKLTAGTINGSVINVTNLNADNITTGTINGQRIGEGSLSLSKLEDDVYTETEVNNIVDGLNDRIDGAIETHTGTAVPTLNNSPASSWNTTKLRDEHVGDVYYVVNSQSQQNGYCYRFTKSGSTYSWQLIKDSDVTAALSRLTTAEGKITTFDSDISTLKTDTGTLTTKTTSLETRMSDAESDILDKVDTTTFNSLEDTVDGHTQTLSQHTTAISNKADSSTVTAVTNRVSKNEQDISGINTTIGELQETVESKADGSTVSTISNKLNTVSDTVDGHTQTLTSVQNTLSTKADSSTVGTLTTKVNNVSDTVDGHTSQLSSITTTQTTMQSTLDKTVKSSIQLWYSKANTTAPNKPTSQVTSTSTSGNAWRIVVPAYNASYPHYYYCWQYEYTDGTYGWSAVVRDIAMGESQSTARTADSNASAAVTTANTASTNASTALSTANTANTNAADAKTAAATASTTASEAKTTAETAASDASTAKTNAASAVTTANSANTKANANIKSSVQLWFTKANSTAPSKPTSVVSTSNANTANAWNLVVPVWNKNYPHYFYCYQQQKGDGTYQWTDVVYDRATSEAQQLANTTSTNLSTLQTNYATFKQQTEQFESTVGTTYATKTELKGATDDITELESRVSTNETSISNNASAIALKANSSDVYTKSGVDGLISTEVTNRNAAITAKANEITSTVSETYATKTAVNAIQDGNTRWYADYPRDIAVREFGIYGTDVYASTGQYEDFSQDFLMRVDFVYDSDYTGQRYCLASPYGMVNPISRLPYPEVGIELNVSTGKLRVYSISDSNTVTDKLLSAVPAVDVWSTALLWWDASESAFIWALISDGTIIGTGSYTPNGTYTGSSGEVRLGADARTTSTWTTAYQQRDMPALWYGDVPSSADYLCIFDTAEKVDGSFAAASSVMCVAGGNVESRVTSAETNITQNAQNIELKVSKDGVISSINQSAETVKIQANRVEIDGAAVFNAISSDVNSAITSKGYQTSSQVESAITSKGYATTTQAQGYASTAKSEAISAAATDATTKASNTLASAKSYADEIKQTVSDWVLDPMFSTGADKFAGVVLNATAPATLPSGCTSCGMLTTRDHASGIQHYGKSGHKLRIHYWCYCVPDSGSTVSPSKMGVGFLAPTANNYADVAKTSASGKWFEFSAVKIVPANTTSGWVKLFIQQENASGTTNTGRWYITGLTVEDVTESAAAMDVANAAAPKANAVKRTQRIWYRTNASSAPATPGTASSNWVTKNDDGNDAWTKMHIAISSTHKYIYTCEQYEMANGTVGYTSVLLDNTITVIDGGNIITGSVTANKLNAANINASKSLTVGAFNQDTQEDILNSNVVVGGRNLLPWSAPSAENMPKVSTANTTNTFVTEDGFACYKGTGIGTSISFYASNGHMIVPLEANTQYTYSAWIKVTTTTSTTSLPLNFTSLGHFTVRNDNSTASDKTHEDVANKRIYSPSTVTIGQWTKIVLTFTTNALSGSYFGAYSKYNYGTDYTLYIRDMKLEKGNKATDWTPAPEDQTEYIDSSVYQSAQPNLTPYFSHSINDVYSSANTNGYWTQAHATVPAVTNDWSFEQSGPDGVGGCAHFDVANTGTSTAYLDSYIRKTALDLKPSTDYTFLVEWFDVTSSGGTPVLYTTTQHGGTNGVNDDYFSTTTSVSITSGSGSSYISATTRATLESGCYNRIRTHLWVGKGITTSGYIRISLYEGEYSGPYKPYSGSQLYATNTALAGTNESLEGAIEDIGELSDQLVGTTTEQNKTIATIQTYLNSLRKDLDAEIQSRQQWLNFNSAEGLVIGATGSSFKTVTTNTSQQFRSGGTVLAETSGTEFVVPVMRSDQLLIGNWMWTRRDNGNLSLKWIG